MHNVVTTLLINTPIILTNGSKNMLKTFLLSLSVYVTGVTGQIIPLPRLYPGVYSRLAQFNPRGIE
jgi:hypothetical protein